MKVSDFYGREAALDGPCNCTFKENCHIPRQTLSHGWKKDLNKGCWYYWQFLRRVDGTKRNKDGWV